MQVQVREVGVHTAEDQNKSELPPRELIIADQST